MKRVNYVFLTTIVMFCTSCEKSTEPPINDLPPPGIQEEIPWPKLSEACGWRLTAPKA